MKEHLNPTVSLVRVVAENDVRHLSEKTVLKIDVDRYIFLNAGY